MNLENMSLKQLFQTVDEIGEKYQSAQEREAFKSQIAQHSREIAELTGETAKKLVVQAWQIAKSEQAIALYKQIIWAIVAVCIVITIGLYKAAQYYWSEYAQEPVFKAYKSVRRRARIAQWQLSRWIKQMCRKGVQQLACEWQNFVSLVMVGVQGIE